MKSSWGDNFIERYIYSQGKSDVPSFFHRFVGISIVAATLQNTVWVELYKNSPLYPNLYTFLIGPSGVGKGRAISAGIGLLESAGLAEYCGLLGGTLTSAALIDYLAGDRGIIKSGTSRAYLVHPELASSIKWGEHSDALVKRLTDLYTGDLSSYADGTRTKKFVSAGKPCINWLAGSTRKWLVTNLKSDAMAGGFMARGLFVEVGRKLERFFIPEYPADYNEVMAELQQELAERIYNLVGPFVIDEEGMGFLREWYMNRPQPKSEEAQASWYRHRELALKIAIIFSACSNSSQIINMEHIYEAITLVEEVKTTESQLWEFIAADGKTVELLFVEEKIANAKVIDHPALVRFTSPRGITSRKLNEYLYILEQQGKVETKREPSPMNPSRSVVTYRWKSSTGGFERFLQEGTWD